MDVLEKCIYPAVDELKEVYDGLEDLSKSADAVLFGDGAAIDSMGLVNFVVNVEDQIESELGVQLTLANEKAMSRRNSPFRTMGTLAEYINELLEENNDG